MSKDPRWKDSKFVSAEPHFRYYCGLPLRTENDINIGALFLLDSRPRDSTNAMRLKVLYTLAHNIMVHMKTVREAHEKQRAIHMNMCIADFISPEHRFRSRHLHPQNRPNSEDRRKSGPSMLNQNEPVTPPALSRTTSGVDQSPTQGIPASAPSAHPLAKPSPPRGRGPPVSFEESLKALGGENFASSDKSTIGTSPCHDAKLSEAESGRSGNRDIRSEKSSPSPMKRSITEADHQRVFDRAAYLLRQALDLEESGGGGVVLLDTNANANTDVSMLNLRRQSSSDSGDGIKGFGKQVLNSLNVPGNVPNQYNIAYSSVSRERVVLAAASINQAKGGSPKNYGRADSSFKITLTPPELAKMCKKFGRGKLFNIPENVGTTLYDWEGKSIMGRLSSSVVEMVLMHRQFPDAKQVIFIPMFHSNLNRWTSILAFTNSRYRVFSYEMDYLPTLSFSNAIKAELTRLATVFADKQKGDFIGSVSHELRSPLHGILASIEFLQDTDVDAFQRSCIDTMDACAHTLLDTVAMVLDYNKVDTIRHATSPNSSHSSNSDRVEPKIPTTTKLRNEPLFVTDQACDIALITEEVIDGLATGHLAKHRTNTGFDEDVSGVRDTFNNTDNRPGLRRILNAVRPAVELILDIESPSDWTFATQPGAIRRIVMNLFGNSLKYTRHGYINVSLRRLPQASTSHAEQPIIVKLVIADTGQGISPEYLRTKIFTPYAQEDAKAAGTGLGLSIVRSIVGMLHGEIDIKSIVNVGTMITVTLPMKNAPDDLSRRGSPAHHPLAASSQPRVKDNSVSVLQSLHGHSAPHTAIYEPALELDSFGQTQGAVHIHAALVQYLQGWYGFPTMKTWDFDAPSKILIVDEIHLPTLLARKPDYLDTLSRQVIILLCANPGRQAVLSRDIESSQVELVCKPFGPHKLAKAICRALEKAAKPHTQPAYVEVLDPLDHHTASATPTTFKSTRTSQSGSTSSTSTLESASAERPEREAGKKRGNRKNKKSTGPGLGPGSAHAREVSASSDGGFPFERKKKLSPPALRAVSPLSLEPGSSPSTSEPTSPPSLVPQLKSEASPNLKPPSSLNRPQSSARSAAKSSSQTQHRSNDPEDTHENNSGGMADTLAAVAISVSRAPRLLLVDDNSLNLDLLHTFVKKRGFGKDNCATAEDGVQAVDAFQTFAPDIIFMDLSMPIMDGLEATRNIRRIEQRRRESSITEVTMDEGAESPGSTLRRSSESCKPALVVALTGNANSSDQTEAYNSGIDIYMTKPVSFRQVGKLLENWKESQKED